MGGNKQPITLHVISHTHWDREWYRTFESFRRSFVFMMDEVLDVMEKDPEYRYFTLDGAALLVDDYLAIRPENAHRFESLIQAGRIIIGPWYVMPDEFIPSGESLVRNLQEGLRIVDRYGVTALQNGYLPDIFGHTGQMPQILRLFDIRSAVVYRGIGDYPRDTFIWRGSDGSEVTAFKLDKNRSYSNFFFALRWPFEGKAWKDEELVSRGRQFVERCRAAGTSSHVLAFDGVDHIELEPDLPRMLETLNRNIPEARFVHSTLGEYEAALARESPDLETIEGDLYTPGRNGINNWLLKNVLSSMVHLKQENACCEALLVRWAEPFDAWTQMLVSGITERKNSLAHKQTSPSRSAPFLNRAWHLLLENQTHDSICGCSITQVHQDNEYRFRQVRTLAEESCDYALRRLALTVAYNPFLPAEGTLAEHFIVCNAGQLDISPARTEVRLPRGTTPKFLIRSEGKDVPFQILSVDADREMGLYRIRRIPEARNFDIYELILDATVPALGYRAFEVWALVDEAPSSGDYEWNRFHQPSRQYDTLRCGDRSWDNGRLVLTLRDDNSLAVRMPGGPEIPLLFRFEDGGDVGDGWVYRAPRNDEIVYSSAPVSASVLSDGPLAVRIALVHRLEIPLGVCADDLSRSSERGVLEIRTLVTLLRDSTTIDFRTELENRMVGHRLRVQFPTGLKPDTFTVSGAFELKRKATIQASCDDCQEYDPRTVPNQGYVSIESGTRRFSVYNRGLYETEYVDATEGLLALTLFRSFEREVSRGRRGDMSRMLRPLVFEYAVNLPDPADDCDSRIGRSETWKLGLRRSGYDPDVPLQGLPKQFLPEAGRFMAINGHHVVFSSWTTDTSGRHILRLFNEVATPGQAVLDLPFVPGRVDRVDFLGRSLSGLPLPVVESVGAGCRLVLDLGGKEIVCLALTLSEGTADKPGVGRVLPPD
jgi:alpha-mannosidase/mannosylglycerate hydrolase